MKVYYVHTNLEGSYNVRCLFPLQANGWDGDRTTLAINRPTPEHKAQALLNSDIIVFHRPDREEFLTVARMLKKQGKKIVFDNDDTYKDTGGFKFTDMMNEERVKRGLERLNETLDTFVKEADLVTCSTEHLKKEYLELNPNVAVLPNTVDPFYYPEPLRNDTDTIRIGITGSVGMTSDMEVLKPIIEHYEHDPRVRLVLLSLPAHGNNSIYKQLYVEEYAFWNKVNVEWHSSVPSDEYYEYLNGLKLDMVIIPRYDNIFNRCKSNIKFLECSMLEIPVVAQSFSTGDSPYEAKKEDGEHVLLANTYDEWIAQIEKLISDKELRLKMGKEAHEYVEKEYNIENNAQKWVETYQNLLDNKN